MASMHSRPINITTPETYIRHLPYSIFRMLADELDPPGTATNWKDFVVQIPKSVDNPEPRYTISHIRRFEAVASQGESPTIAVIDSWSTTNATAQNLMDVLTSMGLHNMVEIIQSKLTQPPPYTDAVSTTGTQPSVPPRLPATWRSSVPTVNSVQPQRPPRPREPTEHESLASVQPTSMNFNSVSNHSFAASPISLEGFSLDGKTVSSYPYSSLQLVTSDFNNSLKLGEGAFGSVFKGHLIQNADGNTLKETRKIAIKRLKLDSPDFANSIAEQFKKEVHVISELRHENILPLMGYSCDGPELCLVYEYMFNGSLSSSLESCRSRALALNVAQRLEIARGSASGISYLHFKKLIHRDIKSSNILLDSDMKARISDFGLIRSTTSDISNRASTLTTNPIGTSVYMSPEAFNGAVSYAMDVFSFGVVLLELLTGAPVVQENRDPLPMYIDEKFDAGEHIEAFYDPTAGKWSNEIAENLYDLSVSCREYRRNKRPVMEKVCQKLTGLCEMEGSSR